MKTTDKVALFIDSNLKFFKIQVSIGNNKGIYNLQLKNL